MLDLRNIPTETNMFNGYTVSVGQGTYSATHPSLASFLDQPIMAKTHLTSTNEKLEGRERLFAMATSFMDDIIAL